jgi:hypothetical protein
MIPTETYLLRIIFLEIIRIFICVYTDMCILLYTHTHTHTVTEFEF